MTRILAIHGILTKITRSSWPATFANFAESHLAVDVEGHYYSAGPLPPWNMLVKNPRIARGIAARLSDEIKGSLDAVHIVGHSNGTHIAVLVAKYLAKNHGIRVKTLVLIGSVLHSDVDRSGPSDLIRDGWVGQAFAYVSPDDLAVRRLQNIPGFYGSLGSRGFERDANPTGLKVIGYQPLDAADFGSRKYRYITRTFSGYGHGDYFITGNRIETYQCILRDMGL